jgi:pantoate--beta-alanine ligase
MKILKTVADCRGFCNKRSGALGFVPTMGALHEGHGRLIWQSKKENTQTLVSIFVNPLQFNQADDFKKYPRAEQSDLDRLNQWGVDAVFLPSLREFYPPENSVRVYEQMESLLLEGEFRPGHFEGMLTVVIKLLNCVTPQKAYFGEKDFQQLRLVRKMVQEFFIPVEIVSVPTFREKNGLALSSRNERLNLEQKNELSFFSEILRTAPLSDCQKLLEKKGFRVEYVQEKWGRRLAAVEFCGVRFIDNFSIDELEIKGELKHDTHA